MKKSRKYDEFRWKGAVEVDEGNGREGEEIAWAEGEGKIEKNGMSACGSEVVHPNQVNLLVR